MIIIIIIKLKKKKENAMFISGSKQGVQYLVLKTPELPNNF